MNKDNDKNGPIMSPSGSEEIEQATAELEGVLHGFCDSVRAEADRPDFFWVRQRNAIMESLHKPKSPKHRRILLWVPAAAAVLLCLLFFAEISKAPTPDLAAGYDQDLLVEVERALNRSHPNALTPALLIIEEMELNKAVANHP